MRFKLDENLDLRLVPLVQQGGYDVDSVHSEGLSGSSFGRRGRVQLVTEHRAGQARRLNDLHIAPCRLPRYRPKRLAA